jgi:cell division protein ZapA
MEDTLLIHVQIGGFRMPLRIPRSDEEVYRKAQRLVDEYIETYQKRYNQRSYEEVLILAAFQLATLVSRRHLSGDTGPLEAKLKQLEAEIDKALLTE